MNEQSVAAQPATPVDLPRWKQAWIDASREAEHLLERLPAEEVGCLYLDIRGKTSDAGPRVSGVFHASAAFWQRSWRLARHPGIIPIAALALEWL